jgi:hypothetical protein
MSIGATSLAIGPHPPRRAAGRPRGERGAVTLAPASCPFQHLTRANPTPSRSVPRRATPSRWPRASCTLFGYTEGRLAKPKGVKSKA